MKKNQEYNFSSRSSEEDQQRSITQWRDIDIRDPQQIYQIHPDLVEGIHDPRGYFDSSTHSAALISPAKRSVNKSKSRGRSSRRRRRSRKSRRNSSSSGRSSSCSSRRKEKTSSSTRHKPRSSKRRASRSPSIRETPKKASFLPFQKPHGETFDTNSRNL